MGKSSSFSLLVFAVILGIGVAVAFAMHGISNTPKAYGSSAGRSSSPLFSPPQFRLRISGAGRWYCG